MSSTNAPQPDATGPAEVFDSTVAPPMGEVSADQGPGANTVEGPIHAGQNNGIDPFFFLHFFALTSFVWDISMTPGQLLYRIPIHPQFVHAWLAHLAKMYNIFLGGFDFSFTIAGTGFHAGKLLVVRLPPNIKPESLKTVQQITAFPYYIIDPKTLETIVKSAMDQRNLMYHYLPFNEDDPSTFGGYIAIYVLLPLATSATGQSQISVQILTKPAPDFRFVQIVPVRESLSNPFVAEDLETALDFKLEKTHPLFHSTITSFTASPGKEIKELTAEMNNCSKGDGTPSANDFYPRFSSLNTFKGADFKTLKSYKLDVVEYSSGGGSNQLQPTANPSLISFDKLKFSDTDDYYPNMTCSKVMLTFSTNQVTPSREMSAGNTAVLREKKTGDPDAILENVFEYNNDGWIMSFSSTENIIPGNPVDAAMNKGDLIMQAQFLDELNFDIPYSSYAPPIQESIVTFQTVNGNTGQPFEVTQVLRSQKYADIFLSRLSMIFELIDEQVNLPIMPFRLHFNGYFTTTSVAKETIFKIQKPYRYQFKYIGLLPETTSMVGSHLPLQTPQQYLQNRSLSRLAQLQGSF